MLHIPLGAAVSGFMFGAAVPVAWGLWIMHDFAVQTAAPLPPDVGHCGMPALGAWMLILFGWPFGGLIGAVLGFAGGAISQISSCMLQPHPATGRIRKPLD